MDMKFQDTTIQFYIKSGASRDKLVLGIPTYGRSYTLVNKDAHEIGSPTDGPGEAGAGNFFFVFFSYKSRTRLNLCLNDI